MPLTQRYFFDLTDGLTTIQDTNGLVLPSLDVAISQAHEALQEMRYGGEFSSSDEEWTLVIRDAAGETLMMLPVGPRGPSTKLVS